MAAKHRSLNSGLSYTACWQVARSAHNCVSRARHHDQDLCTRVASRHASKIGNVIPAGGQRSVYILKDFIC
jgi:hypothetical protein